MAKITGVGGVFFKSSPSKSSFMINYRVDNLGELLEQLRAGGVEVIQGLERQEQRWLTVGSVSRRITNPTLFSPARNGRLL
jgi:hypothetical protein